MDTEEGSKKRQSMLLCFDLSVTLCPLINRLKTVKTRQLKRDWVSITDSDTEIVLIGQKIY